MRHAERAVFDLHRGLPVLLADATGDTLLQPLDGITPEGIARVLELGEARSTLLLTRHRLAAMSREIIGESAALAIDLPLPPKELLRLAAGRGQSLPADAPLLACEPVGTAAVRMLRRARVLPAGIASRVPVRHAQAVEAAVREGELLRVQLQEAMALCSGAAPRLVRAGEARVPLGAAGNCRFVLFRERGGLQEHVAVLVGNPAEWPDAVPVRLHCACLTGDVFGSERCDCGEQLQRGIAAITAQGGGILLYLAQEGRGIGLGNKLHVYRLQDEGLDTVDADRTIGFGDDERDYRIAHDMLCALGVQRVTLLTNNPAKIAALGEAGTEVTNRQALFGPLTDHNRRYLSAMADRQGHLLHGLLDEQEETRPGADARRAPAP
jgi:GTP cyclohydrolase II